MTITLPLEPEKQAKLIALAHAKGQSADELVREVIDKIIAEAPETGFPKGADALFARPLRQVRFRALSRGNRSEPGGDVRQIRARRCLMIVAVCRHPSGHLASLFRRWN